MGLLSLFRKRPEDVGLRHRKEKALRLFREWNETAGFVWEDPYGAELESLIGDAVEIGMFGRALKGPRK